MKAKIPPAASARGRDLIPVLLILLHYLITTLLQPSEGIREM